MKQPLTTTYVLMAIAAIFLSMIEPAKDGRLEILSVIGLAGFIAFLCAAVAYFFGWLAGYDSANKLPEQP